MAHALGLPLLIGAHMNIVHYGLIISRIVLCIKFTLSNTSILAREDTRFSSHLGRILSVLLYYKLLVICSQRKPDYYSVGKFRPILALQCRKHIGLFDEAGKKYQLLEFAFAHDKDKTFHTFIATSNKLNPIILNIQLIS